MAPSGVRNGLRDPVSILAWTDIKGTGGLLGYWDKT